MTVVLQLLRGTNSLNDAWNTKFANVRTFTESEYIYNARLSNR